MATDLVSALLCEFSFSFPQLLSAFLSIVFVSVFNENKTWKFAGILHQLHVFTFNNCQPMMDFRLAADGASVGKMTVQIFKRKTKKKQIQDKNSILFTQHQFISLSFASISIILCTRRRCVRN